MFELRKLPFEPKDISGVVSEETCSFHYGKHHQTYINNLNKQLENSPLKDDHLLDIIMKSEGGLFNNAAQVYNHDFYWDCIAKKSSMSSELKEALEKDFTDFKSEFIAAATGLFGSGWLWLVHNLKNNKLEIVGTSNAATPITDGKVPLLVVDVWEHAYYIDFRNARAKYLEEFYNHINWEFVSKAYEWSKKEALESVRFYINEVHPEVKKA